MSDQNIDSLKALRTALAVEENGLKTYLNFALQTKDQNGKNMFIRLAMDEQEHRRIIGEQLDQLAEGKPWKAVEVALSVLEKVAPKIHVEDQRIKGESGLLALDALETALEMERAAADLFAGQARLATDSEARALFLRLKEWEDAHYEIIQAEIDSIKGTGLWFGMSEFQMDGKY